MVAWAINVSLMNTHFSPERPFDQTGYTPFLTINTYLVAKYADAAGRRHLVATKPDGGQTGG